MSGSPCGPTPVQGVLDASAGGARRAASRSRARCRTGHGLVEDREIAGLLEVRGHAEDEPGRIVVEPGADGVVAALGQRLVLVIGAAARQLGRGDVDDPLAGARGNHVDEAQQVLIGVAEAHAPADARLEAGSRARHVERDHALVGVPDVDHPVHVLVGGLDLQLAEQVGPGVAQGAERLLDLVGLEVALDDRPDALLVDRLRAGRVELVVLRVLLVAEQDDDLAGLAGREIELDVVRAHRLPAVGDRISCLALLHDDRPVPASVRAEERVPLTCRSRRAAPSRRSTRSGRGAPGTRSCGR